MNKTDSRHFIPKLKTKARKNTILQNIRNFAAKSKENKDMARKKKALPLFENVTITDVAAEGKSLARITTPAHDGTPESQLVVFVPFCVPGDVADLQITKRKHSYAEARIVRFRQLSSVRAVPPCRHFGICGGCKWQNLPYDEQLKAKQQQVYDQLTRIGHLHIPAPGTTGSDGTTFHPILGSVQQYEYRNKLEFGFSNKRWLTTEEVKSGTAFENMNACGFHITGAFDKIFPIEKCWLMDDLHNRIRNEIYNYAIDNQLSFFDLREQTGLLRDLMIRNSNTGEWMVLVQFHLDLSETETAPHQKWKTEEGEKAMKLLQHIADNFPEISALLYVDNQKQNDTFGDLELSVFKGNDHIFEQMEELRFKVGPKSFYQTNTEQAYHLYSVVRDFAFSQQGHEASVKKPLVYDLYTGTGTIANFVAKNASRVIGIEYVPEAIEDAKVNSRLNHIDNTQFYAGDMKDILTEEFIAQNGRPDIIITDPPRAGMHQDVVNVILLAHPRRIVYVSCNPATQARDLSLLNESYRIAAIQPVDMFPHTPHVENVVLLEARE